jgi:hypothetical protein
MTPDRSSDDEMTSPEDFERTLSQTLLAALQVGVDPRGTWVFRTDGVSPDLEVMVHELDDGESAD